jgi:MYND finger
MKSPTVFESWQRKLWLSLRGMKMIVKSVPNTSQEERQRGCKRTEKRGGRLVVEESTIDAYLQADVKLMRKNLAVLEGGPYASTGVRGQAGPKLEMRSDGTFMRQDRLVVWSKGATPELREQLRARIIPGGTRCDCCKKTKEALGMKKLLCCQRCNMAYYCSKECQTTQWKAGHKQACREAGEIHPGDFLKLQGLVENPELNGLIVRAVAPVDGNPARWQVQRFLDPLFSDFNRPLIIDINNLAHIRPQK